MIENKYKGTPLNFWQLLKTQSIEIPIIQRDYAQGREDKKEIRDNFLNALYNCLNDNIPIKLDFIYGSVENGSFQPLDGQQRLTTLFLLHWYAARKENFEVKTYSEELKKFSYETRISSREFCNTLVTSPIIIDDSVENLSDLIIDSAWFFLSWKKDPTIDAMLRTIDAIHNKFYEIGSLWDKLTSDNSLISFYHVDLEDIGLTDDLYIKMNARGKLLSTFENFKASIQKAINDNNWDDKESFPDTFACKIDTKWTDLFWKHRKQNSIDEAFVRFISSVIMIRMSVEKANDRINIISKLQDNPNAIKSYMFSEKSFNYLCECFDLYFNIIEKQLEIDLKFPLFQHRPDESIFSAIVYEGNNASYTQKVLFYAQTEYLLRNPTFIPEKFQDWMRVIRNIVSRGDVTKNGKRPTIIRSPQTFDGVINLISELSEGSGNIYMYLSLHDTLKSTFAKEQIEEEKVKSKIIIKYPTSRDVLFKTEDTNLLQGRIDFALYCIDYDNDPDNFNQNHLSRVHEVLTKYLNEDTHINNKLRRALLTISNDNGEYEYYGYWWSFWNVVSADKRCLIDKYREVEYYIDGNYKNNNLYRGYFKKLINQLVSSDLDDIIDNFTPPLEMPNWKIRLIKEASLLEDESKSNYIAIPKDESCCYLLKSMRPRDIDGCVKVE